MDEYVAVKSEPNGELQYPDVFENEKLVSRQWAEIKAQAEADAKEKSVRLSVDSRQQRRDRERKARWAQFKVGGR